MTGKLKAMIVDDHLVVREGLKQLLEVGGEIQVTAEASNGLECMRQLEKHSPDLIFMDVRMPGISGIETTRLIHQKYPHIKIIMLTIYDDDQYVTEAIQAGANGYVLKKVQRDELIQIIQLVMGNQAFLDPSVTAKVFNRLKGEKNIPEREGKESLTSRELEILKGMVAGHTDRKIGDFLHVSEHTVRSHIKNLYRKLRVGSKSQAVAKALKDKIIQEED
ncbi:MAG: DNA-binding response regulator [Deltaproteobacteria bacterium]|jgi:DNA-binding NarL/FixJ family response regulator|nr:DNA-binding response regulator [Deltaproteobacteria bacterium]